MQRLVQGLCPENRRPISFESASAVKYLRLPTALRSKPAYRTPGGTPKWGVCVLCDPVNFWMEGGVSAKSLDPVEPHIMVGESNSVYREPNNGCEAPGRNACRTALL